MTTGTELQTQQPPVTRERLVVQDQGPAAYLFDTARFEHMQRIATAMAHASLIPDHLRGKGTGDASFRQTVGNCLLVVNQAARWNLDPFAVAPETYVVKGKLGFQGKLVAAVVNSRAGLKGRLAYSFFGERDGRTVIVAGQFDNEAEPRTIELSVGQAKTDNKMWKTDPDQKLIYSGVTKWARRHCPEIMLGVLTDDDLEQMRVTRLSGEPVETPTTLTDLTKQIASSDNEPPYNPPTPEEQKTADSQVNPDAEPAPDTQVDPKVEASHGVDEPAAEEVSVQGKLEADYLEKVDFATSAQALSALKTSLKAEKLRPNAKSRVQLAINDRLAAMTATK